MWRIFQIKCKKPIENYSRLKKSFEEWFCNSDFVNPLKDAAYMKKWTDTREKTKTDEAVITGKISVKGSPAAIAIMDGRFMMASMGSVVGEKVTRLIETATSKKTAISISLRFRWSENARRNVFINADG